MDKNEEMREWEKQKELLCELAEKMRSVDKEREKALEEVIANFKMPTQIRLIDLIPYGKDNAISRKMLLVKAINYGLIPEGVNFHIDRYVRKLIQEARKDNVIICKPRGGYYIPDEDDVTELAQYIAKEHRRALAIHTDLVMARRVLEDMEHGRLKKPERRYGDE